jgi:hypothetical protein
MPYNRSGTFGEKIKALEPVWAFWRQVEGPRIGLQILETTAMP